MTAPLSIVIPTLNAQSELVSLLPGLVDGLMSGHIRELIFADGGSTDATHAIAEDAGAVFVSAARGRGNQLAAGADVASGAWLLFLHADSSLPPNWVETIKTHMENAPDRAAVFRLAFDSPAFMAKVTAVWANFRSKVLGLPYGDQGLLIPAMLYRKTGGFDPIPLMEDVAMAKKIKGQIDILPAAISTKATRYEQDGWLRRGARNLLTLLRYKLGTPPEKLISDYYKSDQEN